jgi:hypothetical protein
MKPPLSLGRMDRSGCISLRGGAGASRTKAQGFQRIGSAPAGCQRTAIGPNLLRAAPGPGNVTRIPTPPLVMRPGRPAAGDIAGRAPPRAARMQFPTPPAGASPRAARAATALRRGREASGLTYAGFRASSSRASDAPSVSCAGHASCSSYSRDRGPPLAGPREPGGGAVPAASPPLVRNSSEGPSASRSAVTGHRRPRLRIG